MIYYRGEKKEECDKQCERSMLASCFDGAFSERESPCRKENDRSTKHPSVKRYMITRARGSGRSVSGYFFAKITAFRRKRREGV